MVFRACCFTLVHGIRLHVFKPAECEESLVMKIAVAVVLLMKGGDG